MTLKSHAKFEEKLTFGLENDMRDLVNFYQNNFTLESVKSGTLMGSFCPKQKIHELKICRGVVCDDTED